MSNLLQLQNGAKSFGAKHLFLNANFAINEDEHVGVIGPNGAGKTTLFKILTDQESLDSGEIIRSKSLRIGYLAQHDQWRADETVADYLSHCLTPLWELKRLGQDLGISEKMFAQPIASLSGGYRMRCKLLYLIGQQPNLMLLDEPTNYLDLETTLALEHFLQGYEGAFLLISHDREFLRRTTDHMLEVESGDITKYNGNIDDYFEQKALLRAQLESRALSVQAKRDEVLAFVSRFGAKATKAKQAQSRLKSLDRLETIELKPLAVGAAIRLPTPARAGKVIAKMESAQLGYGERVILRDVNYTLTNGDHLAVVGLNGAGKSTFLKALAQALPPLRGKVELGYQVEIGYYAQHVAESLNPAHTVLEAMAAKAHPDTKTQEILNLAGSLLFSGADVQKKISVLSGGEKSRVALGQILLQRTPCLVLDEPTNHLDFQTVESLTQALVEYPGTLAVVSHDRSFIRRIATKILEVNQGQVTAYPGTYDEYVWSLEKGLLSQRAQGAETKPAQQELKAEPNTDKRKIKKELEQAARQRQRRMAELEKAMSALQIKIDHLNLAIAQGSGPELVAMSQELGALQVQLNEVELEWLELG